MPLFSSLLIMLATLSCSISASESPPSPTLTPPPSLLDLFQHNTIIRIPSSPKTTPPNPAPFTTTADYISRLKNRNLQFSQVIVLDEATVDSDGNTAAPVNTLNLFIGHLDGTQQGQPGSGINTFNNVLHINVLHINDPNPNSPNSQQPIDFTSNPIAVLELGSFEGSSAVFTSEFLLTHPNSYMHCVDMWSSQAYSSNPPSTIIGGVIRDSLEDGQAWNSFKSNLSKTPNGHKVQGIQTNTINFLTTMLSSHGGLEYPVYDFIYIDASHVKFDVLTDAALAWRLLKSGGVVIFDDYGGGEECGQGIDLFVAGLNKNDIKVLSRGYQLAVQKVQ